MHGPHGPQRLGASGGSDRTDLGDARNAPNVASLLLGHEGHQGPEEEVSLGGVFPLETTHSSRPAVRTGGRNLGSINSHALERVKPVLRISLDQDPNPWSFSKARAVYVGDDGDVHQTMHTCEPCPRIW